MPIYDSALSDEVQATTTLPAPTNLSASNVGDADADLSWNVNATDASAHRVYLKESGENPTGMAFDAGDEISLPDLVVDHTGSTFLVSFRASSDYSGDYNMRSPIVGGPGAKFLQNFAVIDNDGSGPYGLEGGTDSNGELFVAASSETLDRGELHTAVVRFENGSVTTYVDGSKYDSQTVSTDVTFTKFGNATDALYRDDLFTFAYWDEPVPEGEAEAMSGGSPVVPEGLRRWYTFDLIQSGTTPDLSEYANDGDVNGPTITGPSLTEAAVNENYADAGGFVSDMEYIGSDGPFNNVWKADATENTNYEDIFTGEYTTSDFSDTGPGIDYYMEFYAKWNDIPDWLTGTFFVSPTPDNTQYQRYVLVSDGQNVRNEYFRLYYVNSDDTSVAYITEPVVTKNTPPGNANVSPLLNGELYEAYVHTETADSQTRDQ